MINTTKVSTSLTNTTRIGTGETWATITSSWASETRTWMALVSKVINTVRYSSSIVNTPKI